MSSVTVAVTVLPHAEDLALPSYATEHAAGMDFYAAISKDIVLEPGQRTLIPTGLSVALPEDHELQIRSRSGLTLKHGIIVLNSPATIDADYRGEIQIVLANTGTEAFTITRGMRVAQMVVAPYSHVNWQKSDQLSTTARGTGGFGSTGVKN